VQFKYHLSGCHNRYSLRAAARRRAATVTWRQRRCPRRGRAARPPPHTMGPQRPPSREKERGGGGAAGIAGRAGVARAAAAATGGTAALTAACGRSKNKLGRCGYAVAAGGASEAAPGRRRGRHPPGRVAALRLVGKASGDAATTGGAAPT